MEQVHSHNGIEPQKVVVEHQAESNKFVASIEGRESFLKYSRRGDTIDLEHTMVAEADRGQGIAEKLTKTAAEYAQEHKLTVIPSCSYVAKFFSTHPEFQHLTEAESQAETEADADPEKESLGLNEYWPVILLLLYSVGGATALTIQGEISFQVWMHYVMGFFLAGFSFFKLVDVEGFASAFSKYDLLAARSDAYGRAYPFIELILALAYLTFFLPPITYAFTLVLMTISAAGVVHALIWRKEDLQCGCMGTVFELPMSKVALFEDLSMALMALAMLLT